MLLVSYSSSLLLLPSLHCGLHAPRNVTALQLKRTVGSSRAFSCSFVNGFPVATGIAYAINNRIIPQDYNLEPSDDGKSISCQVISNYTLATGQKAQSSYEKIIVYYPPEQAALSNDSVVIDINCSRILNFSFLANPADDNVWLSYEKEANGKGSTLAELHFWMENYSHQPLHIYKFEVKVTTTAEYGIYNVCASTNEPWGRSCARLTISHHNDVIEGVQSNLIVLIGVSVAGCALILAVGVGLFLAVRRHNSKSPENTSKSEVNRNEGCADYETTIYGTGYEEVGPGPNMYEAVEQHTVYEEAIFSG